MEKRKISKSLGGGVDMSTMTTFKLRKKSFPVVIGGLSYVDGKGLPHYRPVLKFVKGDVFIFLDHLWGIYRKEHTANKKRINDYVLVDLSTGLPVRIDGRKINILEDLETAWLRQELIYILESKEHAKNEKIYKTLKRGARE